MSFATRPILLVEDNADDVLLTLRAFKRSNLMNPIDVAEDGVEALDYLFARGKYASRVDKQLPALVILDLNLPRVNGLEVLAAIRQDERTKALPVVILTSSKEERDLDAGYSLGANSYVCKPVDFTEFMEAAKTLGVYWLLINTSPP